VDAVAQIGAKQKFIKPHCPWQNGKVERINRTLQTEWAYRHVFTSNQHRRDALAPWLHTYNTERRHSALGGLPPHSRVSPTSWPGTPSRAAAGRLGRVTARLPVHLRPPRAWRRRAGGRCM